MTKQTIFYFNGVEVPQELYYETLTYCDDNFCQYRVNITSEQLSVSNVFRVSKNLQVETKNFAKFLIDMFQRKKFYFTKCVENEII